MAKKKEIETDLNVVEVMDAIRQRIFDGELDNMHKIADECMKASFAMDMSAWETEWLRREMYAAYIIHCAVEEIVPVTGY